MKRFVIAMVLACALSGTAFAGDVHSTGAPAPAQSSGTMVSVILTILSNVVK